MAEPSIPVWISGVGLLSSLGEGVNAHWEGMNAAQPVNLDTERFAPYPVHSLPEIDWSNQISRRDMRQMEPWQRIGTYAAGLALDDAKAKEDEDLVGRMDMIVAAGGGERDQEVDASIMQQAREAATNDHDALLVERLSNDLRPTLFLAQLSNLLAGNISIVHKVTGSSRTFMGEEGAGISAIQTAHARIASGQSDIVLVGGSYNGEREDMLLLFGLGHYLSEGEFAPVWSRAGHTKTEGINFGSIGAFLVLESKEHAQKRGVSPYAELAAVGADNGKRGEGDASHRLNHLLSEMPLDPHLGVLSGASGVKDITLEEQDWLARALPEAPVRAFNSVTGHGMEAQFPLGIALAAMAVRKGRFYEHLEKSEAPTTGKEETVLVTTLGHHRAEGLGVVKPADLSV